MDRATATDKPRAVHSSDRRGSPLPAWGAHGHEPGATQAIRHRPPGAAQWPGGRADVEIRLLPRFRLDIDGHEGTVSSRAERVLVFLALHGGTAARGAVAGTLWPEVTAERALSSLRTALWNLNRRAPALIEIRPASLSLGPDVRVDFHEAVAKAQELIGGRHLLDDVARSIQLLRQELLSDWAEDWILIEQEHFRQLRLHGLESLGELLVGAGRHAQAVVAALEAVACDPLRESAHELLMRIYLAEGNRGEAVNSYDRCARLLRDELGLEPSAEMRSLLRRTLGGSRSGLAVACRHHDAEVTVA
jgi:DNA-binding SARP family transcriptional activator